MVFEVGGLCVDEQCLRHGIYGKRELLRQNAELPRFEVLRSLCEARIYVPRGTDLQSRTLLCSEKLRPRLSQRTRHVYGRRILRVYADVPDARQLAYRALLFTREDERRKMENSGGRDKLGKGQFRYVEKLALFRR